MTELKSKPGPPMPLDGGGACTLETVIEQLRYHRETHSEWALWFEQHPEDPRATQQFGDAAFHRKVEGHYTRMIEFLAGLQKQPQFSDIPGDTTIALYLLRATTK